MFSLVAAAALLAGANAVPSWPPIPGLYTASGKENALFGRGYDPVMGRAKASVFDLHYTNNKSCFNEWASPDLQMLFALPDEVYIAQLPGSELDDEVSTFLNSSQYSHYQYSAHYSVLVAIIVNSAQVSLDASMIKMLNITGDVLSTSRRLSSNFQINTFGPAVHAQLMQPGGSQYNSPFAREVRALPRGRTSDADKAAYDIFLDKFGTHYVSSALLGSQMDFIVGLNKTVALALGAQFDADAHVALELLFFATGIQAGISGRGKVDLSASFSQHAYVVLDVAGGDVAAIATGNYGAWLDSVAAAPAPSNNTYTGIHELVSDPVLAQNLLDAANERIAALNESNPSYSTLCTAPPGVNLTIAEIPDAPATAKARAAYKANPTSHTIPQALAPHPIFAVTDVNKGFAAVEGLVGSPLGAAFSYARNKQFYDPLTKTSYMVPDSMDMHMLASVCLRADQRAYTSAAAVVDAYAGFSFDSFTLKIKFIKLKAIFKKFVEGVALDLNYFHSAAFSLEFGINMYRVDRTMGSALAPALQADIDALPTTQGPAYSNFISKWGTHVLEGQDFGGHCHFQVAYDVAFAAHFDEEEVKKMVSAMIAVPLGILKIPIQLLDDIIKNKDHHVNASFAAHANVTWACSGGDPSILGTNAAPVPGSWGKWVNSVRAKPAAIDKSQKLRAISEIIDSPAKRQLMQDALTATFNAVPPAATGPMSNSQIAELSKAASAAATRAIAQPASEDAFEPPTAKSLGDNAALLMVPGVCNGAGNVGVGCGVDATMLDLYGMNLAPKKPVVRLTACDRSCYLNPDSGDPACEDCTYANPFNPDVNYRVPDNVFVGNTPMADGCVELETSSMVEEYEEQMSRTTSHSSGFIIRHHHSKTVGDFYNMYYKEDKSLSLQAISLIWHSATLMDLVPEPTWEFESALALLPPKYDAAKYREFIQDFGTHYISQVYMGGQAMLTSYYHSCFLEQESDTWVSEQSSTSFVFIFNDGTFSGSGTNETDKTFEAWSKVSLKVSGGDAQKYGRLGRNNTMSQQDIADWKGSIRGGKMVPLVFKLTPITDLIKDKTKLANVNASIVAYVGEVAQINADLEHVLEPQDPYIKPDWCKFSPKPPAPPAYKKRPALKDAIPCPALPPSAHEAGFAAFVKGQRQLRKGPSP